MIPTKPQLEKEFDSLFEKNEALLKTLFKSGVNKNQVKKRFVETETAWWLENKNLKNLKSLLICEAPPASEDYLYFDKNNRLRTTVKNVFGIEESDSKKVFQELSNNGFLLIDSLPFSLPYTSPKRKTAAYLELIRNCIPWWIGKLKHFAIDNNLKIAFGVKLNAIVVINLTEKILTVDKSIYKKNIAADGSRQPNTKKLKKIFKLS